METPGNLPTRALALTAATIVAAALLTAGCDRGAATAAPRAGHCPAAAGVGPHQINLGLLYPASGADSSALAPYRAGVDARLGLANANGGVNGRTVGYQWADDQGQTPVNLAAARRLVAAGGVFAVQEFSTAPRGSASWLHSEGVPVVGTSDDPVWSRDANMFSYFNLMTSQTGSITTWGDYARLQGVRKAAILLSRTSGGSAQVGAQLRTSLEHAGIPDGDDQC